MRPEGLSTLYVARHGRCLGWVGLEDRTRPEASQALEELRQLGLRQLIMVTGDRWSVARRVAKEMGCSDVQAEVLPQDKLDLVGALQRKGHTVAVVATAVNDAPALAAGNLGVAMGAAGSDVAMNSAGVALMSDDLRRLPFLVSLSRETTKVIWQNLIFGIFVHPGSRGGHHLRARTPDVGGPAAHGFVGDCGVQQCPDGSLRRAHRVARAASKRAAEATTGRVALQPV